MENPREEKNTKQGKEDWEKSTRDFGMFTQATVAGAASSEAGEDWKAKENKGKKMQLQLDLFNVCRSIAGIPKPHTALLFAFALVFRQMFVVIQQKAEEYREGDKEIGEIGENGVQGFWGSGI